MTSPLASDGIRGDNAIEVADLRMQYRGVDALNGIDLVVPAGTVIGLSGQNAAVDDNLTGHENLIMIGRLSGLGRRQAVVRSRELLEQFNIAEAGKRRVGTYSGGMRRRIDLAGAIIIRASVLLLDEPTASLDPVSRTELCSEVRALVKGGASVLLTTQYLEEADQLADAVTVIIGGKVVARGTPSALKETLRAARGQRGAIRRRRGDVYGYRCQSQHDPGHRGARPAGVEVADSEMSEPTLDEVFVSLAGSAPRG